MDEHPKDNKFLEPVNAGVSKLAVTAVMLVAKIKAERIIAVLNILIFTLLQDKACLYKHKQKPSQLYKPLFYIYI